MTESAPISQPLKIYAMLQGERRGPFTLDQLADAGVTPDTWIWMKGMPDWERARSQADICRYFRQRLLGGITAHEEPEEQGGPQEETQSPDQLNYWQIRAGSPMPEEHHDYSRPPQSWMLLSILVTIFCCPITGVAAIAYSARTRQLWKQGQHEAAYDCSYNAKMWVGITFFLGLIVWAVIIRRLA